MTVWSQLEGRLRHTIFPQSFTRVRYPPRGWRAAGFWERFFDGEPEAVAAFGEERAKIVAADS
jgi:hypothetical protein